MGKKITDLDKRYVQGFAAACAITLKNHGENTMIRETLECLNIRSVARLRRHEVDDFDIEILKPIIKEIQARRKSK